MENQNQQPTNIDAPSTVSSSTPPVSDSNNQTGKSKFPRTLILVVILFLLLAGSAAGFYVFKNQTSKMAAKPTPSPIVQEQTQSLTPDTTANWKTYSGNGFIFKYPSDYKIETNPQYINVYDKAENLGPANLYLSIDYSLNGVLSDYSATVKEWSTRVDAKNEDIPNGFKVISTDKNGFIYQVDTFFKYKKGAIKAFYRSAQGIPSKIYDQILSTFTFVPLSASKFTDSKSVNSSQALSCKDIDLNPPELTFAASYCGTSYKCNDAKTQKDCESRDVVKVENNTFVSGQDGEADCKWIENSCTHIR